jgi:cysteine desulfurase family protein (TIGR01976 family)
VEVVFARIDPVSVSLDLDHLESLIDSRTRLVALTACSNAFGTLVDVATVAKMAQRVGASTYVDAVHFAPHQRIAVGAMGCDFVVCSSYKFFGPHLGVLWARPELLARLPAFKVRPAPDQPPGRWETGTPPFELLAGFTAAVGYLASIGNGSQPGARLDDAFGRIGRYETEIGTRFLAGLPPTVKIYGRPTMGGRVPTFALGISGVSPQEVAGRLAESGVYAWAGHYYAVEPMSRLGVLATGGLLRIGLLHINTADEVDRVLKELWLIGSS